MTKAINFFLLAACMALTACMPLSESHSTRTEPEALEIFLVRHAEKLTSDGDPKLSPAGYERAAILAHVLRSAKIQHIHSSDYHRTKDTAAPIAREYGLDVQLYDPSDLPGLAAKLQETGGRHLVVGHSNTTPVLAELLGGEPGPPINEKKEYDRLYMLSIGKDGSISSTLLRFGAPYKPDPVE